MKLNCTDTVVEVLKYGCVHRVVAVVIFRRFLIFPGIQTGGRGLAKTKDYECPKMSRTPRVNSELNGTKNNPTIVCTVCGLKNSYRGSIETIWLLLEFQLMSYAANTIVNSIGNI